MLKVLRNQLFANSETGGQWLRNVQITFFIIQNKLVLAELS